MVKDWRPTPKGELAFIYECIVTTFRNLPAGSYRAGAEDRVFRVAADRFWLGHYVGKEKSKFVDLIIYDIKKELI